MARQNYLHCIAFEGHRRIASGVVDQVALKVRAVIENPDHGPVLIFEAHSSRPIDLDLRGSPKLVLKRLERRQELKAPTADAPPPVAPKRGPGRPRLGVVSREVTLLPRHWAWLSSQPGSASVTLRKLIDQARRVGTQQDRVRHAQDATYRFMSAIGGDLPAFEEASRALFAARKGDFEQQLSGWPTDLREHAVALASAVFQTPGPGSDR